MGLLNLRRVGLQRSCPEMSDFVRFLEKISDIFVLCKDDGVGGVLFIDIRMSDCVRKGRGKEREREREKEREREGKGGKRGEGWWGEAGWLRRGVRWNGGSR